MAVVVLVLWLFTAGAGFYLLLTSSLGRARPAAPAGPDQQRAPVTQPVTAIRGGADTPTAAATPATASSAARTAGGPPSRRAARRAARERWDPTLPDRSSAGAGAARRPVAGGVRPPGRGHHRPGFWLGFTLVHNRALGWIAFGLIAATACIGLAWFTANTRAARRDGPSRPGAVLRQPPDPPARQRRCPHPHAGGAHRPGAPRLAPPGRPVGQCPRRASRIGGDERSLSPGAFTMIKLMIFRLPQALATTHNYGRPTVRLNERRA